MMDDKGYPAMRFAELVTALACPVTGKVSLVGRDVAVHGGRVVLTRLDCEGNENCSGKLTLFMKTTSRPGAKQRSRTVILGAVRFTLSSGTTTTVKITLNAIGRTALSSTHGRLAATLTVLKSYPAPAQKLSESVRLAETRRGSGA